MKTFNFLYITTLLFVKSFQGWFIINLFTNLSKKTFQQIKSIKFAPQPGKIITYMHIYGRETPR